MHKTLAEESYKAQKDIALKQAEGLSLSEKWIEDGNGGDIIGKAVGIGGALAGNLLLSAATETLFRGAFGAIDVAGDDLEGLLYDYLETNYPGIELSEDTLDYNADENSVKVTYSGEGDYNLDGVDITFDSLKDFAAEQMIDKNKILEDFNKSVAYGN